jgi:acid phosphatase (class B)
MPHFDSVSLMHRCCILRAISRLAVWPREVGQFYDGPRSARMISRFPAVRKPEASNPHVYPGSAMNPPLARFQVCLLFLLLVTASTITALLSGCQAPVAQSTAAGTQVHMVTLRELEQSLPAHPVHVVFDVDDTALFTSAGFQWGTRTYGKDIVSAGVSVREEDLPTPEAKAKYREFWLKMNNELDQFSVKKWIAGKLVEMHKKRGDRIFFVTKRIHTDREALTQYLRETFGIPDMEPVIFTNRGPKTPAFKTIAAEVSYGDSDGDIRDSIEAGARPIRVMRARTSVNTEPVHNGAFGEEVLVNSEF